MNEVIDIDQDQRTLKTVGHISYLLHTIVAVGAVVPGVQASVVLLVVAFAIDMFKKDDAVGARFHSETVRRGGLGALRADERPSRAARFARRSFSSSPRLPSPCLVRALVPLRAHRALGAGWGVAEAMSR